MKKWKRTLAEVALAAVLTVGMLPASASAQAPAEGAPAAEGEGSGDAVPGYIGVAILGFGAMFVIGKSARR
ncbi:hypothetical protein [Singulisphaera sp. PoT]|uniref:hypothetical protein n=1 Tax=Singulisphaera sp. PoT TaxID=3411797 RepID=UPI003BF4D4A3